MAQPQIQEHGSPDDKMNSPHHRPAVCCSCSCSLVPLPSTALVPFSLARPLPQAFPCVAPFFLPRQHLRLRRQKPSGVGSENNWVSEGSAFESGSVTECLVSWAADLTIACQRSTSQLQQLSVRRPRSSRSKRSCMGERPFGLNNPTLAHLTADTAHSHP